jgi:RNA polymerase sigma-70 factor (ECF subfamily)
MPPAPAVPDPASDLARAITAARAGDGRAWETLLARYQLPLFTFVHELVRHEATSLDLVQAAFVRAVQNLACLRDDSRFAGWLFGIAHQLCAQHFRRAGRELALDDDQLALTPDGSAPDPRDLVLHAEQNEAVFALLAELPEPHRAVLILHVLEDFPLAEIAAITGAPLGTVKSRLHHAKRALRQRLETSASSYDALTPR